jgi:hypothetical protein
MTIALKSIMKCEVSSLDENLYNIYFGHVFSKVCQYVTTDEKVCKNFKFILIKSTQSYLQNV